MNSIIKRTEDSDLLAKLNRDVHKIHHCIEPEIFKPYSIENMKSLFHDMLKDDSISAYVSYIEDTPAGYIILQKKVLEENHFRYSHSVLHIDQICVETEFKGQGVGKALVDFAKDLAKEQDIKRIEMNYWSKNTNSGEFFRSQGFSNYNERLSIEIPNE